MKKTRINVYKIASTLIIIVLSFLILYYTQGIVVPICFGIFFAFMLKPLASFFEQHLRYRILAISVTLLSALLVLITLISLFVSQIVTIAKDLPMIGESLKAYLKSVRVWVSNKMDFLPSAEQDALESSLVELVMSPLSTVTSTILASTSSMFSFLLVLIYTFFFLLYREPIRLFFVTQFGKETQEQARNFLQGVERIILRYFYGTAAVIMILGTLNSIGLYFMGVEYAFFWGFMAAILAVVPYIGTMIGGFFPFMYTLITSDTWWQPLGVIILFVIIQAIEGNVITPKIVGSSVKINPLAAIMGLIIGSSVWGLAGLILALPGIAILKLVCKQVDFLKPLGLLLSSELYNKDEKFKEDFNEDRYRFVNLFKSKKI